MSLGRWLLGGGLAAGVLLAARDVLAARTPTWAAPPRTTRDEDLLNDALRRLRNFIVAARIDATAQRQDVDAGMLLAVVPGARFVVEDSRALPRAVSGIDVVIRGWPR